MKKDFEGIDYTQAKTSAQVESEKPDLVQTDRSFVVREIEHSNKEQIRSIDLSKLEAFNE
ncbi:MAG: hypothetical protein KME49_25820 [Brasilonema octagenarum HA4186-MV1]|jgi:hypothetical protein|uniref:Uncharacterized protein n=2 Tax=Brasilonema TaxID=383614 RepID=A0A856MIL7_9CYAN|nr:MULTISPECIES: hypothetical protein [Brasilonema]MBW4628836.1 hypothetical protein [Brasilonema octagenarum HA4186-MV1]NMF65892.1 hypothetical protein [Brasilonema octagenarum UFV-OR1]QDL09491.1 hypothetical protein DP114_17720 [Brasilonema sennae CENA114]QDL15847.1 hypothetical protein DP113_17655 [Brasilonema octagenarum UFV-E1]